MKWEPVEVIVNAGKQLVTMLDGITAVHPLVGVVVGVFKVWLNLKRDQNSFLS
jgi:hypothetical protein